MIDLLDVDPTDPVAVSIGEQLSGERPLWRWPTTTAALGDAFGYGTWASAWLCDEASGNLSDAFGGVTLTAQSTPTYRNAGPVQSALTDYAVGFDSALDRFHGGDVYDSDASTDIALYMCVRITAASGFQVLAGKGVASAQPYWGLTISGGNFVATVADAVGSTGSIAHAPVLNTWYDILVCIDRTGDKIRMGTQTSLGVDADCSLIGSAGNALDFHLGGTTAFSAPTMTVAYAAIATGGVATLKSNMATAITNIRRFTGRA